MQSLGVHYQAVGARRLIRVMGEERRPPPSGVVRAEPDNPHPRSGPAARRRERVSQSVHSVRGRKVRVPAEPQSRCWRSHHPGGGLHLRGVVHRYRLMGAGLRGSTPSAPKLVNSRPVNVRPLAEPGMVQYAAYPACCKLAAHFQPMTNPAAALSFST